VLEVGWVVKPHGLRGEVIVELVTNRTERAHAGMVLSSPAGDLTIERSTPHLGRWIVTFAGVETREQAEALRGTPLSAEPLDDPDTLWVHELIGADVVDTTGTRLGMVASVEANPASDILVLDGGGLVPLTFVVSKAPGQVVVDPPAGLLD
jgi:16S rRNA processing protein RimM